MTVSPCLDMATLSIGAYQCGKKKKFEARPKLKVGAGCLWAPMYAYYYFLKKISVLVLLSMIKKCKKW
jgi:hypothetical protein